MNKVPFNANFTNAAAAGAREARKRHIDSVKAMEDLELVRGGCGRSAAEVRFSAWVVTVCLVIGMVFIGLVGLLRLVGLIELVNW